MATRRCEVCSKKFSPEGDEKTCPNCNAQFTRIYSPGAGASADASTTTTAKNEGSTMNMTKAFQKAMKKAPTMLLKDGDGAASTETIVDRLYEVASGRVAPSTYGLKDEDGRAQACEWLKAQDEATLARAEAAFAELQAEQESAGEQAGEEGVSGAEGEGSAEGEAGPDSGTQGEADAAAQAAHDAAKSAGKSDAEAAEAAQKAGEAVVAGKGKKPVERAPGKDGKQGPKMTYQWKMRQLSQARQMAVKVRNMHDASVDYAKEVKAWEAGELADGKDAALAEQVGEARAAVDFAVSSLATAIAALESLPADYKPKKPAGGSATAEELKADQKVQIREKARKDYADVLVDPAEVLTVQKTAGTKVVVISAKDGKLVIPRKDLALAS